jgi:hypothetical protein
MGFWGRLFGNTDKGVDRVTVKAIDHPTLGRMSRESGSRWGVDEVAPIWCRGKPSLWLAGDDSGPTLECVQMYQRLREDWNSIATEVAKEIFEMNLNYFSEDPSRCMQSANEVWDSSELLDIGVDAEGSFSLTYRFDWQAPNDGHVTTMYFENWVPAGFSVDG